MEPENRTEPALAIKSVCSGRRLELRLNGAETLDARLVGPVVQAEVKAWLNDGAASLIAFFESMASESYGWIGIKSWAAIEADLDLNASVDRAGHVTIAIRMCCASGPEPWDLTTSIVTELGQLPDLAKQARRVLDSRG